MGNERHVVHMTEISRKLHCVNKDEILETTETVTNPIRLRRSRKRGIKVG